MHKKLKLIVFTIVAGTVVIIGCSGQKPKPFEYHSAEDMAAGPGVFSKDKGEFTIYDSNKNKPAENKASDGDVAVNKPESDKTTSSQIKSKEDQSLDNTELFRQFDDWQRDKAEFEKFQQWKATQEGSKEYEEFLQWKRWQEYQKWQRTQTEHP